MRTAWEYSILDMDADDDDLEDELNDLGREHWQLVSAAMDKGIFIFIRPCDGFERSDARPPRRPRPPRKPKEWTMQFISGWMIGFISGFCAAVFLVII
jgi:hypothetical protein